MDEDRLRAAFARTPVNALLGLELAACEDGAAELRLQPRSEHLQEQGVVHGGILATLADTAAVYALVPDLAAGHGMTSIEFKMNYLRPVRPQGGTVTARSRAVRRGRRVGVCDVDLLQGGELVAKGWFTYLFTELPAGTERT